MDFLNEYHLSGLVIGICTFLIIGLFHPIVVKAEYYWGTKCWWIFLLLGIGGIIASLYTENIMIASLLGVFAFSSFWTIKEIFEQEERVKKGWFPKNPKRIASLYTENIMIASLLGVFAFSSFWTIKEIFEQEERVKKGWFPKNPKRIYKF